MIVMDSKSQLTVDIIAKVAEGKIDIVNASKVLNKSRRTIERYLCLLYTSPSPRDGLLSRMPSSA